ncbi:MAG: hypothetical protein ACOCQN_02795 [Halanaerobiaceae bacterium]
MTHLNTEGTEWRREGELIGRIMIILFILAALIFNISVKVMAEIDPYEYSLQVGLAEEVRGEVVISSKGISEIKLNNNEMLVTDNIRTFTLTYNDNAITLIEGRKDVEDELLIKTGPAGGVKIVLNDLGNNESYLVLGKDTEINILARGGCIYASELDGEGYDRDTLQWRYINPDLRLRVLRGTVRIYYRPNGKLRLGSPYTPNTEIRVNESEINEYIDYEVQVLTGEAAQKEEVTGEGLGNEMEAKVQQYIQNHLDVYNVESIDELETSIKQQLMAQLDTLRESYAEMEESIKEHSSQMQADIVTVLKVYKGEASLEDATVTSGELVKLKGDWDFPGKVEKF